MHTIFYKHDSNRYTGGGRAYYMHFTLYVCLKYIFHTNQLWWLQMLFLFALPFCHSLPLKNKRGRMFCWQTSGIRMKVCCCRCLLSHHRSMRILYAFLCVCCMRTTARYILCCSIPIHMIICIFDIHFVCRCVNESNAAKERWTTSSNQ